MIRSPLGLRLVPGQPLRDQFREAARLGARGVVADATGDLAPDRLSDTGRREIRHLFRSIELEPIALHLPTRRPFDTDEGLDDRLARAERAFGLAFDLGARLVLARVGALPPESDANRRAIFLHALRELGRRADHRGVRLVVETGTESGADLRAVFDAIDAPGLAASIDPAALNARDLDPAETTSALGPWVAHAYLDTPSPSRLGFRAGSSAPIRSIDWAQYLGALEEVGYRGYLTIWPDSGFDLAAQFEAMVRAISGGPDARP